ncbi:hypothetical protein LK996_07195 [Lysobacter sp. A6]|uniref:Uncharacterized protein n=1 Tax=Noviluteimonas lactosilytica TaxID=2888523 RepID=A0ABS8JGZ0_9GAMM|nr:hypothetical protein [Lysobacter lactosilyticus]MCC8362861.1 hypothetical protein [Lysobacter lactosilyticus]
MRLARKLVAILGIAGVVVACVLGAVAVFAMRMPPRMGVVVIACLMLAFACRRVWLHLGERIDARDRQDVADLQRMSRFEASHRPVLLIGATVTMTLVGGWSLSMGLQPGGDPILLLCGVLLVPFALFCSFELLRLTLRPGPMLSMDARGLDYAAFGTIAWDDIAGIEMHTVTIRRHEQHVLDLAVRAHPRYFEQLSWMWKLKHRAWRGGRMRWVLLSIPLNALNQRPELIVEAARHFRAKSSAPLFRQWSRHLDFAFAESMAKMDEVTRDLERAAESGDFAAAEAIMRRSEENTRELDALLRKQRQR